MCWERDWRDVLEARKEGCPGSGGAQKYGSGSPRRGDDGERSVQHESAGNKYMTLDVVRLRLQAWDRLERVAVCERCTVLDGPHRGDDGNALAARAGGIGQAEGSDRLDRLDLGASGCVRLCERWRLCEQHRGRGVHRHVSPIVPRGTAVPGVMHLLDLRR